MGWASRYIQKLREGEIVSFRPHGQSMTGRIESGQLCTVAPVDPAVLDVGDIVLCKVAGNEYLHIVKSIKNGRYQIGNNRGFINSRPDWLRLSLNEVDVLGVMQRLRAISTRFNGDAAQVTALNERMRARGFTLIMLR